MIKSLWLWSLEIRIKASDHLIIKSSMIPSPRGNPNGSRPSPVVSLNFNLQCFLTPPSHKRRDQTIKEGFVLNYNLKSHKGFETQWIQKTEIVSLKQWKEGNRFLLEFCTFPRHATTKGRAFQFSICCLSWLECSLQFSFTKSQRRLLPQQVWHLRHLAIWCCWKWWHPAAGVACVCVLLPRILLDEMLVLIY